MSSISLVHLENNQFEREDSDGAVTGFVADTIGNKKMG